MIIHLSSILFSVFINGLVEHYGEKLQGCFFANDFMGVSESVKQCCTLLLLGVGDRRPMFVRALLRLFGEIRVWI